MKQQKQFKKVFASYLYTAGKEASFGKKYFVYLRDVKDCRGKIINKWGAIHETNILKQIKLVREKEYKFTMFDLATKSTSQKIIGLGHVIQVEYDNVRLYVKNSNSIVRETTMSDHVLVEENITSYRNKKTYIRPLENKATEKL